MSTNCYLKQKVWKFILKKKVYPHIQGEIYIFSKLYVLELETRVLSSNRNATWNIIDVVEYQRTLCYKNWNICFFQTRKIHICESANPPDTSRHHIIHSLSIKTNSSSLSRAASARGAARMITERARGTLNSYEFGVCHARRQKRSFVSIVSRVTHFDLIKSLILIDEFRIDRVSSGTEHLFFAVFNLLLLVGKLPPHSLLLCFQTFGEREVTLLREFMAWCGRLDQNNQRDNRTAQVTATHTATNRWKFSQWNRVATWKIRCSCEGGGEEKHTKFSRESDFPLLEVEWNFCFSSSVFLRERTCVQASREKRKNAVQKVPLLFRVVWLKARKRLETGSNWTKSRVLTWWVNRWANRVRLASDPKAQKVRENCEKSIKFSERKTAAKKTRKRRKWVHARAKQQQRENIKIFVESSNAIAAHCSWTVRAFAAWQKKSANLRDY